ncbi:6-bladed beta-propeller [uncultured Alistipes sp.]|jgi:hypothetical protein|uniref:6-bladed beta-propeller n=1 Tax=uncultured Alistipes sp. TaxID=538949 RepID=UPI0025FEDF93|nr:6-bladed beta-propeller [uncultured Alistipes sp.]
MTRLCYYALVALFLCGCTHKENKNGGLPLDAQIIEIKRANLNSKEAGLTIDHVIKLQTSDKALINQIAKVVNFKDKLYIFTAIPQNNVYIFTANGEFLYKITKGRANNEVFYPMDISVDEKNGKVLVLDFYRNIKEFSLDGKYLASHSFPESQFYLESVGENNSVLLFCPNMSSKNEFTCYLKDGKTSLKGLYKTRYVGEGYQNFGALTKLNQDSVLVCPLFSDTIYLFNNKNKCLDPYYVVDCDGDSANAPGRIETFNSLQEYTQSIGEKHWFSGPKSVLLSRGKIFFNYGQNNKWGVFDSRKASLTVYERMFDDLPNYFGKVGQDNGTIIYAYDIPWLQNHFQEYPPVTEMGKKIEAMCGNEEDNPILVFAKIK